MNTASVFARGAVAIIGVYRRLISPIFPPRCRFEPSCSEYAVMALDRFGLAKGSLLLVFRLARCHPFHAGGIDPVPRIYPYRHIVDGSSMPPDSSFESSSHSC